MKELTGCVRLTAVYASVLFVGTLLAFYIVFDEDPDLNGDNTNYHMLGKALSEGRGYTNTDGIVEVPATNFPPGYPALVAVVMTFFSDDIITVKVANGVFFAVAILLLFYFFYRLSDDLHLAFVVSAVAALNGHLLRFSTLMMSEIPFLLFTTATLVLFLRVRSPLSLLQLRNPNLYLFLFCLVFSYYIRTAGLALVAGVLLVLLLRRDWKSILLVSGVFILAVLPWSLRSRRLGVSSYVSQFSLINPYQPELGQIGFADLLARILNNAGRYISQEIPNGCLGFVALSRAYFDSVGLSGYLPGLLLVLVMAFGVYSIRHHRELIATYLLATAGVLLVWPEVWVGTRFLTPVIPLLLFCFFNGLWTILRSFADRYLPRLRLHPLYLLLLILPTASALPDQHEKANAPYPAGWQRYFEMARWTREHLPEDAVVCCRKSSLFYLYAQRYVMRYDFIPDTDEFIEHLKRKRVTHVVLDNLGFSSSRQYLIPAVVANPHMFTIVHQLTDPSTFLLEFHPDATP